MTMNLSIPRCLGLIVALIAPFAASAEQSYWTNNIVTNRFTLSARFGFNIKANFQSPGAFGGGGGGAARFTPEGAAYNYDDGYVLTDVSGNFGGQTWYWGYDDSVSQISGNNILLSRSTPTGGAAGNGDLSDSPYPGFELTYNRLLKIKGDARIGVEAAINYMPISLNNRESYSSAVTRVTDSYAFTPNTTPPAATPANPYQGSFNGPGFLIGDTPVSSITTLIPGIAVTDQKKFEANLIGFRLGPYLDWPLSERWMISASGGLALGLLNARTEWDLTVGGTPSSGRGSDFSLLWGFYLGGNATYRLSEKWSITGGAQFQTLGKYEQTIAGRKVEVDFSKSIFVNVGMSYRF